MIRRLVASVLLVASGAVDADGQGTIQIRDPGRGPGTEILTQAMAKPHRVLGPASTRAVLAADSVFPQTVIVLGRDVVVEAKVQGDVIVVGGDLYMHPGADVTGRVIAIGGGAYESELARVSGGSQAYRDFTYDFAEIPGGWALSYHEITPRSESFAMPGLYGLKIPSYDRTNGLSLPVAPVIAIPGTRGTIEPRLTYRSQLGRLDPSVILTDTIGTSTVLTTSGGRGTFTNDAWIWTNLANSLYTLLRGADTRNYFRATRVELTAARRRENSESTSDTYIGARFEDATSVRPTLGATGGPWSFLRRNDVEATRRPNPLINPGTIKSILIGTGMTWAVSDLTARLNVDTEVGSFEANCVACTPPSSRRFAQATIDGSIEFPAFSTQTLRVDVHGVGTTRGSATPKQRWAYIGGSGTIPTIDVDLSRGGDQLIFFDARYTIPLERVNFPYLGMPTLTLREVFGGADLQRFPALAQALGARLAAGYVYVEFLIDPPTRKHRTSFGFTLAR